MEADPTIVLATAKTLQGAVDTLTGPKEHLKRPRHEAVLPGAVFLSSPFYIKKIVDQINVSYNESCFDACAILSRRLVEVLLIEVFEYNNCLSEIQDDQGAMKRLSQMIEVFLASKRWTLNKATKTGLRNLKDVGDLSAHSRRYSANRGDIDRIYRDLRVATQEMLHLADLT
jgi:hypothetical protein